MLWGKTFKMNYCIAIKWYFAARDIVKQDFRCGAVVDGFMHLHHKALL